MADRTNFDLTPFVARVEREELNLFNVIVYQDGELIAEKHWRPVERIDIRSGTKSFCSTAVGFAASEGLFSLEDYVVDSFAEDIPEDVSMYMKEMQLKHLLTMTMGFEHEQFMGSQRAALRSDASNRDWVKFALQQKVIYHPGEKYLYNNIGPYLLGILIQRKSGQSLLEYLKPRLFDPLGIENVKTCEKDPMGNDFGASGFMLDVFEYAKLGRLYLQDGRWKGQRILPKGWVEEATAPHTYMTTVPTLPGYELYCDNVTGATYGYFFWIGPWSKWYFACGAGDQYCIVVPSKNAVITMLGNVTQYGDPTMHAVVREIIERLP